MILLELYKYLIICLVTVITAIFIIFYPATQKDTLVVTPLLTQNAYNTGGFYDYYNKVCDSKCLTVKINQTATYRFEGSYEAIRTLLMLDYDFITDYDLHQESSILKNYRRIILLHNEYVTQEIFDAVTSHKNVIYLYPNALYAQVTIEDGNMTLIKGHNYENNQYPVPVDNGFGWQYDNTHTYEHDRTCKDWQFYEINNGWMLNCYPEQIMGNQELIKAIKSR